MAEITTLAILKQHHRKPLLHGLLSPKQRDHINSGIVNLAKETHKLVGRLLVLEVLAQDESLVAVALQHQGQMIVMNAELY